MSSRDYFFLGWWIQHFGHIVYVSPTKRCWSQCNGRIDTRRCVYVRQCCHDAAVGRRHMLSLTWLQYKLPIWRRGCPSIQINRSLVLFNFNQFIYYLSRINPPINLFKLMRRGSASLLSSLAQTGPYPTTSPEAQVQSWSNRNILAVRVLGTKLSSVDVMIKGGK